MSIRCPISICALKQQKSVENIGGCTIQVAYSKKLKSTDMIEILREEILEFEKDLAEHVAKANAYGKAWMDKIGITAVLNETRMTIKWFKNLTVEELHRSFKKP